MAKGFGGITKIPELRKRILFTLGMLAIYRILVFVSLPGVNRSVMKQIMAASSGSFLGMFNMFSGGALEQLSIIALGIMPYISSSIIFQLLTVVIPSLERLQKEGEAGRKKINQYTRYGTILISIVQGYFIGRPVPAEACEREMRRRLAETALARRSPRRFRPLGPTALSVVEG